MAMIDPSLQLGCGRSIDDVWDDISKPPDGHTLSCAFCQAARVDLADLSRATDQLRDDELNDDALHASPATIDRILSLARTEVRRGRRLPLVRPAPDHASELTVSEQAVSSVIRRCGDQMHDIQIRRCAVELVEEDAQDGHSGPEAPGVALPSQRSSSNTATAPLRPFLGASLGVALRVSVGASTNIPEVVNQLRASIIAVVDRQIGMVVDRVDVTVEDVHDE